jgi:hypothetical protein
MITRSPSLREERIPMLSRGPVPASVLGKNQGAEPAACGGVAWNETVRVRMKHGGMFVLAFSAILLFTAGCISEPGFDRGKFEELKRVAQDLKTAVSGTSPCDVPDALQQRLVLGIAAVKEKGTSPAEDGVLAAYSHLLTTYRDGLLLCRSRSQMASFAFFPKGRIYVSQDLDALVEKYDLSTERHRYEPTGQYMRSIDGDAITVIWERVQAQIQNIENMIDYR